MPRSVLLLFLTTLLGGCGSQEFSQLQAERQAAWQEMQGLQQQRTALTRNLLASTRALPTIPAAQFAKLEQARDQAAAVPVVNPDDVAALQRQLQTQAELAHALSPLLEQARRQSGLQALAQQFDALDNRMRVAQQRYQLATRQHNQLLASFPSSLTARVKGLQPQALLPGLP